MYAATEANADDFGQLALDNDLPLALKADSIDGVTALSDKLTGMGVKDLVIDTGGLVLPRDDVTRYAFVLYPLVELAADERHPVSGRRYADHWLDLEGRDQPPLRRVEWPPQS